MEEQRRDERDCEIEDAIQWKPCGCKERIEKKLLAHYASELKPVEVTSCLLNGYGWLVTEAGVENSPYMPFEVVYLCASKRNGSLKERTKKGTFHFSYCPFCGQPASMQAAVRLSKAVDGSQTALKVGG